jgi:hypothetical protein
MDEQMVSFTVRPVQLAQKIPTAVLLAGSAGAALELIAGPVDLL